MIMEIVELADHGLLITDPGHDRTAVIDAIREHLITRGRDQWSAAEAVGQMRLVRTWWHPQAGFCGPDYESFGSAAQLVAVATGLDP